jgi:osmotically-inducible protein OsmY
MQHPAETARGLRKEVPAACPGRAAIRPAMNTPPFQRLLCATLFAAFTGVVSAGPEGDEALAASLRESLSSDRLLKTEPLQVVVEKGTATLSGKVASLARAERAATRALAVEGVQAVVNRIEIATPRVPRGGLAEELRRHLGASRALDASRVRIVVRDRVAVLSGEVGSWDEQEIARELATEIPGILRVDNRLEVSFDTVRTDEAIHAQIAYQIADDPAHDGLSIRVEVGEGIVRLSGKVGSSKEKERLVQRAYVTGVTEVWAEGLGPRP